MNAGRHQIPPLVLWRQNYDYAYQVVDRLSNDIPRNQMMWAVGEDIAAETKDWKHWETEGIAVVVVPIDPQIHASDIRSGRHRLLDEIREYAESRRLYLD